MPGRGRPLRVLRAEGWMPLRGRWRDTGDPHSSQGSCATRGLCTCPTQVRTGLFICTL